MDYPEWAYRTSTVWGEMSAYATTTSTDHTNSIRVNPDDDCECFYCGCRDKVKNIKGKMECAGCGGRKWVG